MESGSGYRATVIVLKTISVRVVVPAMTIHTFSTHKENQSDRLIEVYQREKSKFYDKKLLNMLAVGGMISPIPRGEPQTDICFDIDVDGILNVVVVVQKSTGNQK